MRILAVFIVGFILFFYLSQNITWAWTKIKHKDIPLPFNHSILGLIFILSALYAVLFTSQTPLSTLISLFVFGSGLGVITHHLFSQGYILFKSEEQGFIKRHRRLAERSLEILPGALTWIALTSPIWLSFALPFAVAYLIILADTYWLINSLKIAVSIYIGYRRMIYAKNQNWQEKIEKEFPDEWEDYYHLVLLPTYKEGLEVLIPAFNSVTTSRYPLKKIFLAVGFESRSNPKIVEEASRYLKETIAKKIGGVFVSVHPYGLPGEVPGPGTNRNWMVKNAVEDLEKKGISANRVIATTVDADFVLHPQFLSGALHKYLSTDLKIRNKRSYTGVFLYYNNYWQSPTPMRLIAGGTAFWQLAEMVGSDKYMNFSSMSINLQSLLDIGLWIPDKVNDDSGFFWKAYYHFKGDYKVIPHFLPITADTVMDENLIKTFQNQYLQLKRWAYGVEHIPFIVEKYFTTSGMDFWDKTDKLLFSFWGYLKWGTLALFVTFAALLIPLVNPHYTESVVSYNLPVISSWILTTAFLGMFATIYVHERTVPPRPKNWSIIKRFWSYLQWVLIPLIIISISTIPAIDAQTSLMIGKYLEYRTTNKVRVSA